MLGYSRQAFYQGQQQMQKEVFEQEILLQEVLAIRTKQKRLGGRRLLIKLNEFMQSHAINMGRDAFFDLLSYNGLLVKNRKRKNQLPLTRITDLKSIKI